MAPAVHGHEGPGGTIRLAMDTSGNDLFAGAGLAGNQYGGISRCDLCDHIPDLSNRAADPDKFLCKAASPEPSSK